MRNVRDRISEFIRQPYGVGAPLNIYMFLPARIVQHARTAVRNPRYFVSRIRVMAYQLRHPSEPWLTQDALRAIKSFIAGSMRAFEWGSGKSTLWLAQHVREVVSIEHDASWYSRVQGMLNDARIQNTQLKLAGTADYAAQITAFPDHWFDFILIDGADRNGCIRAAASKVRPGGWIVVDNAESALDYSPLAHFRRIPTRNGVWQTDIFVRSD